MSPGRFREILLAQEPIRDTIFRRAPISGQIALMAIVISWVVGLPVGIISAIWRNSIPDYITRVFVILFVAIPAFWVASWWFSCASFSQLASSITIVYFWDDPIANLQMTLGPACVLGIGVAALMARMTRSSILEVLHEDYVRTARAKGVKERVVVWRHVLRNALLPVVTVSGLALGGYWAGQSPSSGRSWCLAWARPWFLPSENGIG